jgi:hypothetical protein
MSPRTHCAVLFTTGCIASAALVILYGVVGLPFGAATFAIAWLAAGYVDPTKWSHS